MPSLGIFLILGIFIYGLDRKIRGRTANRLFRVLVAIVLVLLMVRTVRRNGDWSDPATLAAKTVQSAPGSSRAHNALGTSYYAEKKYDLALEQYRMAESIYAEDPTLLHNIGIALFQLGNSEEAIRYFSRAVDLAPLHITIRFNLAYALRARGDLDGAKSQYDAIISLYDDLIRKDPSVTDYHFNKANALVIQERYDQALVEYRRTLEIDPDHDPARRAIFDLENRRRESAPPAPHTGDR
jgi:tetratricopeptide (TPR) repeat protein